METDSQQNQSLPLNRIAKDMEEGLIEAFLFISGDPVPSERLAELLGKPLEETNAQMQAISEQWEADETRGCSLVAIAEGWQIVIKKKFAVLLKEFMQTLNKPRKLSATTLETLAIIASKQPVTRQDVEMIRGVGADYAVNQLLALGLIEEVGKNPGAGRASLYGTTQQFLLHFGLRSIKDLPEKLHINGKGE